VHLDVRVEPGGHLAEDLEDQRVAEDQRRVALLGPDHDGRAAGRQLGRGRLAVEREAGAGAVGGDALHPQGGALLVLQRVVHEPGAARTVVLLADERMDEVLGRLGVGGERQLVGLGLAVVVGDLDQVDPHA
jgi:hypothetical protein